MSTRTDRNQTFDGNGNVVSEQVVVVDDTVQVNDQTIRQQAEAALANLRTIRDAPQVSVTSLAQAQTVCRQLQNAAQAEASVLIRLARLVLARLDGTD